jgi:hypothetical protein
MRKFIIPLFAILTMLACRQDNREPLFDLFYPNFQFTVQAGENPILPGSYTLTGVATNINTYLNESGVDTAMIGEISALEATLTAINGRDYNFLQGISVRICPDTQEPCIPADEAFYLDDLQRFPEDDRIELIPGLRNVRRVLIKQKYRLEVVMFFAFSPQFNYESQLNMSFRAFK